MDSDKGYPYDLGNHNISDAQKWGWTNMNQPRVQHIYRNLKRPPGYLKHQRRGMMEGQERAEEPPWHH